MSVDTRTYTIAGRVKLETETCCRCGVLFAMPADLRQQCLDHPGRGFYCPNGHSLQYGGKSAAEQAKEAQERADRLARQLNDERTYATGLRDQLGASTRSNRALRAAHTRTRNRIARGVCPCCNRTFADLARHMAGQHPDYAGSDQ